MDWKPGISKMIRCYLIHHKETPEDKIALRTPRTLTAREVKEKIKKSGFFVGIELTDLRVRRERTPSQV